ncbi:HpcH/HpaI aldolase/citrate lyase family protein [Alcaligenaceae bacterium CGII-47]|nr:HpcH/HpaI aldolase/citrate lyase family protein [Alcaligenaceae bacterium CGII-47]
MEFPQNVFKRRLIENDGLLLGLFVGLGGATSAELLAGTGYDWLLIDGEHGPNDLRSILDQLRAVAAQPVSPVVRVVDHDPAKIKQLLDIGAQTLLVPMVESAEQARALVRATRYPPEGIRGVGSALARAAQWNGIPNYLQQANAQICLILQVESQAGVDALDDILAVDGVDAVFIGPSDLAASMGYLGQSGHPEVKAAVDAALARITHHGVAAGVFALDPNTARAYCAHGVRFAAIGVDTVLLRQGAVRLLAQFKVAQDDQT